MSKRKRTQQAELWCPTQDIPSSSNPFYDRLNKILSEHGFDDFVEDLCEAYYKPGPGRPSIAPGVYFRMIFVGYFEQIGSERQICWRIGDSLSLRRFVGLDLTDRVPDHSTLSVTRQRYGLEVGVGVFDWLLGVMRGEGLLKGKRIGIDSTTLQANASMKSLRNKVTKQSYQDFAAELAAEVPDDPGDPPGEGPPPPVKKKPSAREVRRKDRKRRKKMSNLVWESPADPDAKITRMKNGSTRMAHKVEHAVDLETGAIAAVEVYGGCEGDTLTIGRTLSTAHGYEAEQTVEELVADAGYHSKAVLNDLAQAGIRSYIPEPKRRKSATRRRTDPAVRENRRRQSRPKAKALHGKRGELVERTFQHLYHRCGLKELTLRGTENILKRLILHAAAFNLSLLLRKQLGCGTPKGFKNGGRTGKATGRRSKTASSGNTNQSGQGLAQGVISICYKMRLVPNLFWPASADQIRNVA